MGDDADRLSWHENRHTILRKLLEDGGWDAVRWLRANVSDDEPSPQQRVLRQLGSLTTERGFTGLREIDAATILLLVLLVHLL